MKRLTLTVVIICNIILIAACSDNDYDQYSGYFSNEDTYYEETLSYEIKLEEARAEIVRLQDSIDDLESSINNLENEVDRFRYDDWRDVVSDVVYETNSVKNDFYYVTSSADDLERILD